jgi:hypothetical protein
MVDIKRNCTVTLCSSDVPKFSFRKQSTTLGLEAHSPELEITTFTLLLDTSPFTTLYCTPTTQRHRIFESVPFSLSHTLNRHIKCQAASFSNLIRYFPEERDTNDIEVAIVQSIHQQT